MDLVSILPFSLAAFLCLVLHCVVTIHILLFKEDVKSAIGWIGLVWLAPIIGTLVYIALGINRIHRKALSLSRKAGSSKFLPKTDLEDTAPFPQTLLPLLKLGVEVHPQPFCFGNRVQAFENGDAAYPAMCQLIAQARKEVLLQSYIFNNDAAGQMFLSALRQAALNGARIKVLVDGVGKNYSSPTILHPLHSIAGLETAVFLPSKKPFNLPFVNLRNHRKILIVDGSSAFFGGMNIAQGNLVDTHPKGPIADVTFHVHGPVVRQIARVFEEDWNFATKKKFTAYTPDSFNADGSCAARIIPDGPDSNYGKISYMFTGALACAQKSIKILTPYFLPEENILSALEVASMRGVKIEILLPQKSNIFGMDRAMRANFKRLLKRHIKIYRTVPPFDHSKILLVDDQWAFIGSANWDVRSLKLNFECNMECIDKELASQIHTIIAHKKKGARREHLSFLKHQPWYQQLVDNTFKLLTPYY